MAISNRITQKLKSSLTVVFTVWLYACMPSAVIRSQYSRGPLGYARTRDLNHGCATDCMIPSSQYGAKWFQTPCWIYSHKIKQDPTQCPRSKLCLIKRPNKVYVADLKLHFGMAPALLFLCLLSLLSLYHSLSVLYTFSLLFQQIQVDIKSLRLIRHPNLMLSSLFECFVLPEDHHNSQVVPAHHNQFIWEVLNIQVKLLVK